LDLSEGVKSDPPDQTLQSPVGGGVVINQWGLNPQPSDKSNTGSLTRCSSAEQDCPTVWAKLRWQKDTSSWWGPQPMTSLYIGHFLYRCAKFLWQEWRISHMSCSLKHNPPPY